MSHSEHASKPLPVFTKLAVLLRNIRALQFGDLDRDHLQNARQILNHVRIPKAQHHDAALFKPTRPRSIARNSIDLRVLAAIKFDREPQRRTIKIQDETASRMLSTKIGAKLIISKSLRFVVIKRAP